MFKPKDTMFNLEENISDWRKQMLAAGIQSPVPLEELESHLREEIAQQMKSGTSAQTAFETSVARIGGAGALKQEFKKIGTTKKNMLRTVVLLAALFGTVFGTVFGGAMILPALGHWRDRGVLQLGPLLAGSAVAVIAGCAVIYGVRTYREARGRKKGQRFYVRFRQLLCRATRPNVLHRKNRLDGLGVLCRSCRGFRFVLWRLFVSPLAFTRTAD